MTEASKHAKVLQRGDLVPHFEARTVGGDVFSYATVWQSRNLVLVTLPGPDDDGSASELTARAGEFGERGCAFVVTRDDVPGMPVPGALVADQWGEIVYVAAPSDVAGLPTPTELLEWLYWVERRCPECEGEVK